MTILAPLRLAISSALSIRGWLVPGFWPASDDQLGVVDVLEADRGLADADRLSASATLVDSWHMLEQSGRLLVPNARTKSW